MLPKIQIILVHSISILIADSVSLIFSSGLKEFNASTKQKIAEILKTCTCFVIFTFFCLKNFNVFLYHYLNKY